MKHISRIAIQQPRIAQFESIIQLVGLMQSILKLLEDIVASSLKNSD